MIRALKIFSFLLLLFILTAEDCSNTGYKPGPAERQQNIFQEISDGFEQENPGEEGVKAFENRAVQMLEDLFDYINIYADSGYSGEFRLQAKNIISGMFLSEIELNSFYNYLNLAEDEENGILLHEKGDKLQLKNQSISLKEKLSERQNLFYSGILEFKLTLPTHDNVSQIIQIEIILKRSEKFFGDESGNVWKVFFGSVKLGNS